MSCGIGRNMFFCFRVYEILMNFCLSTKSILDQYMLLLPPSGRLCNRQCLSLCLSVRLFVCPLAGLREVFKQFSWNLVGLWSTVMGRIR